MGKTYISHIRNINGTCSFQSNEDHCRGVADFASKFADSFGFAECGRILGLLHNKGKENNEFQKYSQDINNIPGHKSWTAQGKAHAYIGAFLKK